MIHRLPCCIALAIFALATFAPAAETIHIGPRPDRRIDEKAITYFVAVNGNDANSGRSRQAAFATLQKAADVVKPGETVLLTRGVYHQGVHIRKEGRADAWITFIAEEGAEIRGSEVWKDWKPVAGRPGVYVAPRPRLHGSYQKPDADLKSRTEQVFVNGVLLRQVPDPAMLKPRNTFWVDDENRQLLVCLEGGKDPNQELTEVSTLTYAIAIGGPPNMNTIPSAKVMEENKAAYIRIDGFTIRHMANFSRMAAIQARGAWHHVIIENCDVQWVNYCGIGLTSTHNFDRQKKEWFKVKAHHGIVRNNIASNCGAQGIGGGDVDDLIIEANLIDNNNYKGMSPWSEGGAVKTGFGGARINIRWNVARNNDNHGLWYDYATTDCIIENNFVYNAVAGAILNEVTPSPGDDHLPDGTRKGLEPTAEQAKRTRQKGTIIRNNILVGTRVPGGGGINISSSCDTDVHNNITAFNAGGGINFGGSPTRPHTQGLHRNQVHRNISFGDFRASTSMRDSDDKTGRFFDNVAWSNLYVQWKAKTPFQISGQDAGIDQWKALNKGRDNIYSDKSIFKNPEHFDFTLTPEGLSLARQAGFDPTALRLDWSAYYVKDPASVAKRESMAFTPISLASHYNRALADETAGDGRGGWTDQGANDLSAFPTGRQTIDGVEYLLGTREKGAILLANDKVRPGGFPQSVDIPVGAAFDELRFLYTAAWTPAAGETARFIIHYADGSSAAVPIVAGRHLLDWQIDPTWQQHAALNDNRVYAAWQARNPAGRVTVYHHWWQNPEPRKAIARVAVTNQFATEKGCFFLLGLTGASRRQAGENPRVFHISFDGDVDAIDSAGGLVEAQGFNAAAFDAGKFIDGRLDKGFVPSKPMHYAAPRDLARTGQGTMSVWLRADDWRTAERQAFHKRVGYTRVMTPVSTSGGRSWAISVEISSEDYSSLRLNTSVGGLGLGVDATPHIRPGEWFNVLVRWQPHPERKNHTRMHLFIDGKLVETRDHGAPADQLPERFFIGVPSNGGQPWRGAMDDFEIWNRAFSDDEVHRHAGK